MFSILHFCNRKKHFVFQLFYRCWFVIRFLILVWTLSVHNRFHVCPCFRWGTWPLFPLRITRKNSLFQFLFLMVYWQAICLYLTSNHILYGQCCCFSQWCVFFWRWLRRWYMVKVAHYLNFLKSI